MSSTEIPMTADAALSQLASAPTAAAQSTGLWQTAIVAIGRRVASAVGNTDHLASDAAAALAESLGFDFCGVAKPGSEGGLSLVLSAVKAGVTAPTEPLVIPDQPQDSLVAFAITSGRMITTQNFGEETRYRDAILRRYHAQTAVACPLRSNGAGYGSILLANLTPRPISPPELVCIETISHLVAAALARSRVEQLLEQAQVSVDVLEAVETPVVTLDAELRLLQINKSCQELTGFSPADVQRRPFCGAFVAAGDEGAVIPVFKQLLSDSQPARFEARLLRKHGGELRVEWRFRRLAGNREGVLVGTGIDVTAKSELEGQVARLQSTGAAASKPAQKSTPASSAENSADAGGRANRRKFPRRAYPYVQRLAPIRHGRMPRLDEFDSVECRDISAGGFAFYSPEKPVEREIIVAFGAHGKETFLTARIMHVRPAVRNGKAMYSVGCQYTGRHTYDPVNGGAG